MLTPERFRELLLDYLYDLLDEADPREVRAYLEAHSEAQAELSRTRGLLAGAARQEFPAVRFSAPAADGVQVAPVARDDGRRRSGKGGWVRWAVAAAVVIAVGGIGVPVAGHLSRYYQAQENLTLAQRDAERARQEREEMVAARNQKVQDAANSVKRAEDAITEATQKHVKELIAARDEA